LIVLAAVGSMTVGSPLSVSAQLRGLEVRDVLFEGNETFPADSLARAIATRETACRSWVFYLLPLCPLGIDFALSRSQLRDRDLPRDRARLTLWYRQRGFRDVQVDTPTVVRSSPFAEVTFRLVEGPPVIAENISFLGVEDFVEEGLLTGLPIRPGERLSTIAMDATRDSIIQRLSNRGYAYAEVFRNALRPADDPYNAIVTFEVVPGPPTTYGDISVEGVENLGVGTVLRTVQLTSGDPYRRNEIDEAARRLYGLEIVRNASVIPDTVADVQDPSVDIAITVQEGDAYRVRTGGGWSNSECLSLEARWTSRNFFGGGRLLSVRGRLGNLLANTGAQTLCPESGTGRYAQLTGIGAVEFVQPWIFSTRNALSASVFVERQSLPEIFVRRAIGGQLAVSRTISPRTILTGFVRPELSELDADNVLFCTGFLVCSPGDVAELEGANWLSPVGLSLTRDRTDDLLNPRTGYRVLIDLEHAATWTTSDFRYDRVLAEASGYASVGRLVFAGRMRGGWVRAGDFSGLSEDIVHPQKRFYSGGANSVRGFAQSSLGPRTLFFATNDLLTDDPAAEGESRVISSDDCNVQQVEAGGEILNACTPSDSAVFRPQPTGGTRLIEANVEVRFPIGSVIEGAVFTDAGRVWRPTQGDIESDLEFTPGVGVRFPSPVGPIRIDLAYRSRGAQLLDVVTDAVERSATGTGWVSTGELVLLPTPFNFGADDRGLQLHVSIGQAF
jgi:outer membrane protein insertion porin family/translocation and assembly module TamA